jgi:hypothetical protein
VSKHLRPGRLHRWQQIVDWARTIACCPTCQVTPGVPCHRDGIALRNGAVHARRYQEAEETAA